MLTALFYFQVPLGVGFGGLRFATQGGIPHECGRSVRAIMFVILKGDCVASLLRGILTFYAGKEDRAMLGSNPSALLGGVQGMGCPLILNLGGGCPGAPVMR